MMNADGKPETVRLTDIVDSGILTGAAAEIWQGEHATSGRLFLLGETNYYELMWDGTSAVPQGFVQRYARGLVYYQRRVLEHEDLLGVVPATPHVLRFLEDSGMVPFVPAYCLREHGYEGALPDGMNCVVFHKP